MAINWFPGHMHKARKEIAEIMPKVDLIIEVLDARIPYSSENPLVPELRGNTPCIKILNKCDLADPAITELWLNHYKEQDGVTAIALTQQNKEQIKTLLPLCCDMVPHRNLELTPLRALILGIPNVGKSTLINTLAGRIIAKTGNEPAVTKAQQRIRLENNIVLHDTPGFLWPKLEPEACGYRLATTGAIKSTVIEYEDVAMFAAEYFLQHYPTQMQTRFDIEELPETEIELLDMIAARRGCLRKGGIADLHKVSEILLNEYRDGILGCLSLETPIMIAAEQIQLEKDKAKREERKKMIEEELLKKKKKRNKNKR